MRKYLAIAAMLLVMLLVTPLASLAQNFTISATTTATDIVTTAGTTSVTIRENSSSPTASLIVVDYNSRTVSMNLPVGGSYTFVLTGAVPPGTHIGSVATASSTATVIAVQRNVPVVLNAQNSSASSSSGGAVSSVFTRTGAVVAAANDYSFNQLAGTLGLPTQCPTCQLTTNVAAGCQVGCSYGVGTGSDSPTPFGGTTTLMTATNTGQWIKFYNNATRTLGNGTVRIGLTSSGGLASANVYSVSGNTLTRIWTSGALSTTTAGAQTNVTSNTPVTLQAGQPYYLMWCADNLVASMVGVTNAGTTNSMGATGAANSYGIDTVTADKCIGAVAPTTATVTNIVNSANASMVGILATN